MTVKPTIWSQLEVWAQDFKPWQRFLLANAVRFRQLTDEQTEQVYRLFLHDNDLMDAPNPPIEVPSAITGRPFSDVPTPLWLRRIGDLRAINALPADAELTFSPTLTVVYGSNGVGKSGFTRVLSNVCFSRVHYPILPNVYDDESKDSLAATIVISDGAQKETAFVYDGLTEHVELKRISVFDTHAARAHLVERSPMGFKPAGFDVFPEMARVYHGVTNRLTKEIDSRNRRNTFTDSFIAPESAVSQFVSELSADSDMVKLRRFATFSETEKARLSEVQQQIIDLQSKSVAETISQLELSKRDLIALQIRLVESSAILSEERRAGYRTQLDNLADKVRLVATQGAKSFKQDFFKGIGTQAWENFLTAAYTLAKVEHEHYPREDDHCLLCHRPLDSASIAIIKRFWEFVASEARQEAEEASTQLNQSVQALKALRLDFFSKGTTVRAHLTRLDPSMAKVIDTLVATMESDRRVIISVLESAVGDIGPAVFDDVDGSLTALIAQIDTDITRIRERSVEEMLKALESERIMLRHQQVLNQLLPEVEKYVSDLKWVKQASGAPQRSLNTRPLTDKESELFATVIARDYRVRFADECNALECNLPVEFHTQGQRGQTLRSLIIKGGHSPDKILSEGEQRAVALADFLTEIALNPANAGIVLDDPVTSQDHQRKNFIARRLVLEAKKRQVIIFTHDLVFLTMLASTASAENIEMLTHWIQRDSNGNPGQISPDDCPATTPQYRTTQKAQKTLDAAMSANGSVRMELIQRGMGELRRTMEEIIPHYVLKQVVNRWTDRIIVTALRRVNWDNAFIEQIIGTYEELSAYIEGHSHTEEWTGAPPEPKHLEDMIARVNCLIKQARPDRKN